MMDLKLAWRAWKTRHREQVFKLRVIWQALRGGGVALDMGANKGSDLYAMARWAGSSPVVAFKPQSTLARYLAGACTATLAMLGLGESPAADFRDAKDCYNNFIFRPTGAAS